MRRGAQGAHAAGPKIRASGPLCGDASDHDDGVITMMVMVMMVVCEVLLPCHGCCGALFALAKLVHAPPLGAAADACMHARGCPAAALAQVGG